MFQIQRLVLVPSLLHSLIMYLGLRVSIQSYIPRAIDHFYKIGEPVITFLENFNLDFMQYHIKG